MAKIPQSVLTAWGNHVGPVIFTTVNQNNIPNSVYATCVSCDGENRFIVADNYFDKTRSNIQAGSRGSFLFITAEDKSYQIKGQIEYHQSGPLFDDMKQWNPEKHPGHAAVAVVAEEIYSGADKII
ncbi:MAG: pyridoxamine 5-phosphate oxidase [Desulfuromonadales bacterium C00003068]|jgi:predicted pyridoxine 5'-phosphate oxidase superfamily flavin-nucleotide-binding protein|nr:pyridoxamine 5'-phosphate oxidase family protein [Deltaproteobacteria bacterium]OEU73612.1 MAG: pyridoxamine 5-phosphate oxidase [Desulfuromonadales bacterium C00003068]